MNFELVEINPEPCFVGLREIKTVIAVSNSSDKLYQHCIDVYGKPAGEPEAFTFDRYYIIRSSGIEII